MSCMAACPFPAAWSRKGGIADRQPFRQSEAAKAVNIDVLPRLRSFALPSGLYGASVPHVGGGTGNQYIGCIRASNGEPRLHEKVWKMSSKDSLTEQRGKLKDSSICPGSVSPFQYCVAGRCASDRSSCVTVRKIPMIITQNTYLCK